METPEDQLDTIPVNTEQTGKAVASKAGKILASKKSLADDKSVAASGLSQAARKKRTGAVPVKTTINKK